MRCFSSSWSPRRQHSSAGSSAASETNWRRRRSGVRCRRSRSCRPVRHFPTTEPIATTTSSRRIGSRTISLCGNGLGTLQGKAWRELPGSRAVRRAFGPLDVGKHPDRPDEPPHRHRNLRRRAEAASSSITYTAAGRSVLGDGDHRAITFCNA